MDPLSILSGSLQRLLDYFQRERHYSAAHRRAIAKDREDALLATHKALVETRRYLEPLFGKEGADFHAARDRDTEYKLSELWSISAIRSTKFMDTGPDLDKAREWLHGLRWETWSMRERRTREIGIDLETMERRLEELIRLQPKDVAA
jgi:hypothetical protein